VKRTKQCSNLSTYPVKDDGYARDYVRTYHAHTMVTPINIPIDNDGNIRGYVSTTKNITNETKHVKRGQVYERPYMSYARRTQCDTDAHQTAGISIDIIQYVLTQMVNEPMRTHFRSTWHVRGQPANTKSIPKNMVNLFSIHSVDSMDIS